MIYTEKSCKKFIEAAASKEPVPGGGSVAALAGALGTSLGHMVGALTVGKKKYADVEDEMMELMKEGRQLQRELLDLVQADIDMFEPLSQLYSLKPDTDEEIAEKERLMEEALENASAVPLQIMEKCGRAIELSVAFAKRGSRIAVSDAGSSAILCKAALQAASLNVYINTRMMQNRARAEELNEICAIRMMKYTSLADEVFECVSNQLKKGND